MEARQWRLTRIRMESARLPDKDKYLCLCMRPVHLITLGHLSITGNDPLLAQSAINFIAIPW